MKNMKLWKRMLSVLATGAMVVGCLAGCGDTTKESQVKESTSTESTVESTATETTSATEEVKEPVELTYYGEILGASTTLTSLSEMEIMKAADEACNTVVTYVHPAAGTEQETFNLRVSSGEFEDIMEANWGAYAGGPAQAIEDGVIIDLAPYIEQGYAPNFKKLLDENPELAKQITTDEGQIFAFPAIGDASVNVTSGFFLRADMLEAVDMEVPETIADWEAVLTAFKDKLGVEAPFTGTTANIIAASSWFAGAFGTSSGFYVEDGKVHYGYADEAYKDYVATMADWYAKGLIDNNIFGNDSKATQSNLLNDKSGAAFGYIGSAIGTFTNNAKANENTNPDFKLVAAQYPVLNEGDKPQFVNRSWDVRTANQAAITTSCEDIEAAMAYLDFWYSEEGNLLKNFGIEGLTYEMVNGEPVYTDLIMKNPDGLSISQALGKYTRAANPTVGRIDIRYYEQYYQLEEQVEAMYTWNEYADNALDVLMPSATATSEESEELATIESSVQTYAREEITKFIMGTRDMAEYDSFLETLKGMGVDRMIEIKQAAYDRYMAR